MTQNWLSELGQITRHPSQVGDVIHARVAGQSEERILLLAHVDTVYPLGAWNNLWSVKEDRVYGPGTYDMKAGFGAGALGIACIESTKPKTGMDS